MTPRPASAMAGAGLLGLLALPPFRETLEASMPGHMLIQLPLLAVAGGLVAGGIPRQWRIMLDHINQHGIPGLTIALFCAAFWMLPRSLDGSLTTSGMETAKFVTLPLLLGAPLVLSWRALAAVGRGFVAGNAISMLVVMGFLYHQAPMRVCNYYLVSHQQQTGLGLILAAAVLSLYFIASAFFINSSGPSTFTVDKENSGELG